MLNKEYFHFVRYNEVSYPANYPSQICEIAAHFDKNEIPSAADYSLHTEYSYGKRKFDTERMAKYPVLIESSKDGVPQLWKSIEWASAFADFIIDLVNQRNAPRIIEIHPPFTDYCNIEGFIERFRIFESKIHNVFPETLIVVENRAGTIYRGGKFLIGKAKEIVMFAETVKKYGLSIGIVLDFPQLLTAENIDPSKFKVEKYWKSIELISEHRDLVCGIHIWGKKKSHTGRWVAHCGNFDTYFDDNREAKKLFIAGIERICNDNRTRFLVPEVNSGANDLNEILKDLFEG